MNIFTKMLNMIPHFKRKANEELWKSFENEVRQHAIVLGQHGWNSLGIRDAILGRALARQERVIVVGHQLHRLFDRNLLLFRVIHVNDDIDFNEVVFGDGGSIAVELGDDHKAGTEIFIKKYHAFLDETFNNNPEIKYVGRRHLIMAEMMADLDSSFFNPVIFAKSRTLGVSVIIADTYNTVSNGFPDQFLLQGLMANVGSILLSPMASIEYLGWLKEQVRERSKYNYKLSVENLREFQHLDEVQWASSDGFKTLRI